MNKREFTDTAKKILQSNKILKSPQIMHPERDWLIGLFVAVLLFGASAVWSAQMNLKYKNIIIADNIETDTEIVVYRESLVQAALQEFSSRQETHEDLLASVPKIINPDLLDKFSSSSTPSLEAGETASSSPQTTEVTNGGESSIEVEAAQPDEVSIDATASQ